MKMKGRMMLLLTLIVAVALSAISYKGIGSKKALSVHRIEQGLDLSGGVDIVYEADQKSVTDDEMKAAISLLQGRLDWKGWTEAEAGLFPAHRGPLRDGRCFHDRKREAPSGGSMCGEFSLRNGKARLRQRRGHRPAARPKGGRTMSILECKALTKRYGGKSALEGVELSIEPGRIVGLLGPNGSGKTTLIKLANGLLTPTSGEILIDGKAPSPETKAIVSYLPDRNALPDWMTVAQTVDYYADFYADFRRDTAQEMLARLGLDASARVKTLSKGTREKLQLILVMSRAAKLYLLDEPIGGVDPATRDYILSTIISNYNPEAAVVISTHLIADVEHILDDVAFLSRGHLLLQSSADDLRAREGKSVDAVFREVFRC